MAKASNEPVDITPEFASGCITQVFSYQELVSTNLEAMRLASRNAPSGTVVVAARQTKGRGRLNRTWESPEGGLYCSVLLRPPVSLTLSLLPLLAGLAVTATLEDYHVPGKIRWPNDVLVDGKKVAGILLELESSKESVAVVIGVGINLNVDLSVLSPEVQPQALSLAQYCGHPFETHEVLRVFLQHFSTLYSEFLKGNHSRLRIAWKEKSDTLGRTVRILTPQGPVEGDAVDIDEQGFIQVRRPYGQTVTVSAGDCLYLR